VGAPLLCCWERPPRTTATVLGSRRRGVVVRGRGTLVAQACE